MPVELSDPGGEVTARGSCWTNRTVIALGKASNWTDRYLPAAAARLAEIPAGAGGCWYGSSDPQTAASIRAAGGIAETFALDIADQAACAAAAVARRMGPYAGVSAGVSGNLAAPRAHRSAPCRRLPADHPSVHS